MRKSFCLKVIGIASFLFLGINAGNTDKKKKVKVEHNWIRVPWSLEGGKEGGHYYHNTKTREDRDTRPPGVEL